MKKILIILIILLTPRYLFAINELDSKIKEAYNKIYHKIYTKNTIDKGLNNLYSLQKNLEIISNSSKINEKNSPILSKLQKLNSEKIFSLKQEYIRKKSELIFSKNPIINKFRNKIYDSKNYFSLENGVWYYYNFKIYGSFYNTELIKEVDIKKAGLNYNRSLIFTNDSIVFFVKDYKKHKIINDNIIYGVPNKIYILELLKKYILRGGSTENLNKDLLELKIKSENIISNSAQSDEKIEKIYSYILNNIKYEKNYNFDNPDFFSGLKTFKNKSGVCEGYVELFIFMLAFSNIDSKMVTGDVLNASDFGKIGHAWIKIGNYYYDPTFDDGGSYKKESTIKDWIYFKIPEDLFYTNRYNTGKTPEKLKEVNIKTRERIIRNNLGSLYEKYKDKGYNLLNEIKFRKKYNIEISKSLEISDLIKARGIYYETNLETVNIDGETKYIKEIKYFILENTNIFLNNLLLNINYKIDDYTIFKVNKNGKIYYIISNNYSLR